MNWQPFNPNRFNPRPKVITEKKPKKGLVKKSKPTGEANLFKEIWNERKHLCEHCGVPIHEATPANFDHILTKKQRPDLRLDKKNIRILCFDCHFVRHNGTKEDFNKRKRVITK